MLSSSGFRDALGERDLRFDRESGQVCERLLLRPELAAYESALRRRVCRLASLADPRLVPLQGIAHDSATGRLAVLSGHASGLRLQQVLRNAREHELVPDLTIALFLTAELLNTVQAFQSVSGIAHGAIAPERIVITADGEVMLADYAYAEVIEAARFTPARLWNEFGIAHWLGAPISFAGDVRQCALTSIALVLGRPLDSADLPDGLDNLLAEVNDAAMIRGGRLFAEPVMAWLRRALGTGGEAFDTTTDAAEACGALLTDRERSAAGPAFTEFLEELDAAPPILAVPRPAPIRVSIPTPVAAEADLTDSAPSEEEPRPIPVLPEPIAESIPEAVFEAHPFDSGPFDVPEAEPESITPVHTETAWRDAVVPGAESAASTAPIAVGETAPWPPPPTPASGVIPDTGPRVVSPSPFALIKDGARPQRVTTSTLSPSSLDTSQNLRIAAPMPIPSPITLAPAPGSVALEQREGPTSMPIRLKDDTGRGAKEHARPWRFHNATTRLDLSDSHEADDDAIDEEAGPAGKKLFSWKIGAAAAAIVVFGLTAMLGDWGSSAPTTAVEAKPVVPAAAPAPAPTTGSIEVISNNPGSKVLIDGKARGEAPLTLDGLTPGNHVVVVRASNGSVRRTVKIVAGETTKLDLAVYSGWVIVSAPIELQVLDGGKAIGAAGEGPIVLAAGHHTIEVSNEPLGYRSSHPVDIQPGEEERLFVDPHGLANLNAVPWAEVWVDGNRLGETPLGNVTLPLGTRDFIFRHPEYGERKVSATIMGSTTAQISVDFTKP